MVVVQQGVVRQDMVRSLMPWDPRLLCHPLRRGPLGHQALMQLMQLMQVVLVVHQVIVMGMARLSYHQLLHHHQVVHHHRHRLLHPRPRPMASHQPLPLMLLMGHPEMGRMVPQVH